MSDVPDDGWKTNMRVNLGNADRPFGRDDRAEAVFGAWGKTMDEVSCIQPDEFEA